MKPTPAPSPKPIPGRYEAENSQRLGMAAIKLNRDGYFRGNKGDGYVDMGGEGSYIEWSGVDGGIGGDCTLEFRYAFSKDTFRRVMIFGLTLQLPCEIRQAYHTIIFQTNYRECDVAVNGASVGAIRFETTGSWSDWNFRSLDATCTSGTTNVVRLTALVTGGPNIGEYPMKQTMLQFW